MGNAARGICHTVFGETTGTTNLNGHTPTKKLSHGSNSKRNPFMKTTVFGYGSLMNYESTLRTMPTASNFRCGILYDYERIFNLVSLYGIRTGVASWETNEVAGLAIRPQPEGTVKGCLFDIPTSELLGYIEREHRYKRADVVVIECGTNVAVNCLTVLAQSDEEYKATMDEDEWNRRVLQFYDGQLWGRKDIFPMRQYLIDMLYAAHHIGGDDWLNNLLDFCLISKETILREYIVQNKERFEDVCGQLNIF